MPTLTEYKYRPRSVAVIQVTDENIPKIKDALGKKYLNDCFTPEGGIKYIIIQGFSRRHVAMFESYIVIDEGKIIKPLTEEDFHKMFMR